MANKVSSNGKDDIGSAYANKQQSSGQRGFADSADSGGVHKRRSGFEMGNAYRDNQASGARGFAKSGTKAQGGDGSNGQPTY
jgi:hypothetical protein